VKLSILRYWGSYLKSYRGVAGMNRFLEVICERGWNFALVMEKPPENKTWMNEINTRGAEFVYLPRPKGNFDWKCVLQTYRWCKRLNCDIFHCDNMHTSPLLGAGLAGVPVRIWSKRSMNHVFEAGRTPSLRDKLAVSTRLSCFLATNVLAISDAVKEELVQLAIPASNIITFNNPMSSLNFSKVDRKKARSRLGFGEDDIVVTAVGHSVPVKGWDVLLKAFGEIAGSIERMKLLFVGSCAAPHEKAHFDELTRLITQMGLTNRVTFTGYVDEVTEELRASDIFVLPSRSEGNSNALIEAVCAGLPCVATRVGTAEKFIKHNVNGFLVDREDHMEMAHRLRMLGTDENLRGQMASMSKPPEWVQSPEEHLKSLLDLYENLAAENRNRHSN